MVMMTKEIISVFEKKGYSVELNEVAGTEYFEFHDSLIQGVFTRVREDKFAGRVTLSTISGEDNPACEVAFKALREVYEKEGKSTQRLEEYLSAYERTYALMKEFGL